MLEINLLVINAYDTPMCLSIGTPKSISFPFGTNGKLMVFECLSFQHIQVVMPSLVMQDLYLLKFIL